MTSGNHCNTTLIYSEAALRSIVGLTIAIGFGTGVGNLLVMASVYCFKNLRSLSNFFLVSLAASDLLVGTVIAPLYSLTSFKWPVVGTTVGQVYDFIVIFGLAASSFSLVAVTYDRHLAISSPLQYSSKMTLRTCRVILFTVWTCSIIVGLPNFITKELRPRSMYFIVFVTICFFLPLIFIVIVQIKILHAVKRQSDRFKFNKLSTYSPKENTAIETLSFKERALDYKIKKENASDKKALKRSTMDQSGIKGSTAIHNRQKTGTSGQYTQRRSSINKNEQKQSDRNIQNESPTLQNEQAGSTKERSEDISIINFSQKSHVILFTIQNHGKSKKIQTTGDDSKNNEYILTCSERSNISKDAHKRHSQRRTQNTTFQDVNTESAYKEGAILNTKQTNIANVSKTNGLSHEIATRTKQILKQRKYSLTMMIVIGCFALCWLPNVIVIMVQASAQDICAVIKYEQIFYITMVISLGNSLLNPFIYCTRMEGFRTAFKVILKCKCRRGT